MAAALNISSPRELESTIRSTQALNSPPVVEEEDEDITSVHDYILISGVGFGWKIIACTVLLLQALVLAAMYLGLNTEPCSTNNDELDSIWYLGIPLCCVYAGASLAEDLHRFIILWRTKQPGKSPAANWVIGVNVLIIGFAGLIMAMIMIRADDLKSLISDFIGISVVYQCDELLASVIKLPNPSPGFYKPVNYDGSQLAGEELKQWKSRMQRSRTLWTAALAIAIYVIAYVVWWNTVDCDKCEEVKQCLNRSGNGTAIWKPDTWNTDPYAL